MNDDIEHKKDILDILKGRLRVREKQKAQYGVSVDPVIIMEINELKKEINDIEKEIISLSGKDNSTNISSFRREFNSFLDVIKIDWISERDSDPTDIDDGKQILRDALDQIKYFRSRIEKADGTDIVDTLEKSIKEIKILQKHRLYIDGGISFHSFWDNGDAIIEMLNHVLEELDKVIE
jgi:hypothetical protein